MRIADDARLADKRIGEWFISQQASRERDGEPGTPHAPLSTGTLPLITISRQFGAGGHTIAEKVAALMGEDWQVWDRELIDAVAEHAQVRRQMIEALDEHTQSWMDQVFLNAFGVQTVEAATYRRYLSQVLLALAQQGKKIVVGRGANFLTPGALNVRLRAAEEYRALRIMQREHLPHDEALRKVQQTDRERAQFTREMYGRNVDDPAGYDLVIQVDTLSADAVGGAIVGAARALFR